jgi:hypothetical protein
MKKYIIFFIVLITIILTIANCNNKTKYYSISHIIHNHVNLSFLKYLNITLHEFLFKIDENV